MIETQIMAVKALIGSRHCVMVFMAMAEQVPDMESSFRSFGEWIHFVTRSVGTQPCPLDKVNYT
jgi:hypothetical protein